MLENWLKEINYDDVTTGIDRISNDSDADFTVYNLSGQQLMYKSKSIESLHAGIYIINGNKTYITQ